MKTHVTLLLGAMTALTAMNAVASSHREAPNVTRLPAVDSTDFYAFRSYEEGRGTYVTLIANYIPLQDAYGGPNYFAMDPNALYEIHIDNDGDAVEDITFQFRFEQKLGASGAGVALPIGEGDNQKSVAIPLKNFGNVDNDNAANFYETYSITKIMGDRRTGSAMPVTGDNGEVFAKPLDNIGEKSFADYEAYANTFIHDVDIPGCSGDSKVFVGQRKDPFVVNLGKTFDLVNYDPVLSDTNQNNPSNDDLADKNVTTIALEVPISCVTSDAGPVIGAWTSASLPQARILNPDATFAKPEVNGGAFTQVSRLGMPLVNEVVIGLSDKDAFSASEPKNDGQFLDYVTHPTLPALLDILFRTAVGAADNIAPSNIPRNDLVTTFLTGFPGVNQVPTGTNADLVPSEMTRLNTAIAATAADDQSAFGVVAGDLAGFPNGRRPGDDVVDIALRAVMGALCHPIAVDLDESGTAGDEGDNLGLCSPADAPVGDQPFSDLAPIDAKSVDEVFPYLKAPLAGSVTASSD